MSFYRFKRKTLGRQTGVSPETNLGTAWNVFAVTSPLFLIFKPYSKCEHRMVKETVRKLS